ncbi:MAG: MBL fold metallo-hydrolase [Anaerolineales bacterium]|nr:MBL fold metallo-hydrolase [Anaerolineales bacterium]MCS7247843.1 MBL fold metallo-hydrolase [Anaerolineales bacterium]MDW8161653.1 MBL fold metallo-hydrolase [Anaerolineales bacterium]MDW8448185.1 MBL fold metallo-hydrolase [Anaerolineales bacterium]
MSDLTAELLVLGSASAIPTLEHENTHLLVVGKEDLILIDCPNNLVVPLQKRGFDPLKVTHLILTHFHADHVAGVAPFLMSSWLMGRRQPLHLYGLEETLWRFEKMMELFQWETWNGLFPIEIHRLPPQRMYLAFQSEQFEVYSSPVHHLIDTVGLRIRNRWTGECIAYSCDTEPCEEVVELAQGCKALIHEAVGAYRGHTSPQQAGEIARRAEAQSLYLIHYPSENEQVHTWEALARTTFDGVVGLAQDGLKIPF